MTQPAPQPNDREHVQTRVIAQLTDRYQLGIERYKTALQVGNGRRMSKDFREELQDALIYATGMEMVDEEIVKIVEHLIELHREDDALEGICQVCMISLPCHTVADLEKILNLLGVNLA